VEAKTTTAAQLKTDLKKRTSQTQKKLKAKQIDIPSLNWRSKVLFGLGN
jgi:hypothetical protein